MQGRALLSQANAHSKPTKPSQEAAMPMSQRSPLATRWRCLNCGQLIFVEIDQEPPEICQFCRDMTTWQWIDS